VGAGQPPEVTIRKYRIVQAEGARTVERLVDHYSLDVVIAEYLTKGFAIDDEWRASRALVSRNGFSGGGNASISTTLR
jgi:hypothetical protein